MPSKLEIKENDVFKQWRVICEIEKKNNTRQFNCECLSCHNEYIVNLNTLRDKNKNYKCVNCSRKDSTNRVDINPGEQYNDWTVLYEVEQIDIYRRFMCQCKCGRKEVKQLNSLRGEKASTACSECNRVKWYKEVPIGEVVNGWKVIKELPSRLIKGKTNNYERRFLCECDNCGKESNRGISQIYKTGCMCKVDRSLLSGKNHPNWNGGVTNKHESIRRYIRKYITAKIFKRDNYTCVKCKNKGGVLHAHHIYDFSTYEYLRKEKSNLITLCEVCHKNFHSIYSNMSSNTLNDLENWLHFEYKYRDELMEKVNNGS